MTVPLVTGNLFLVQDFGDNLWCFLAPKSKPLRRATEGKGRLLVFSPAAGDNQTTIDCIEPLG